MKFCHVLDSTSQRWPDYRNIFFFYKLMKKQIKIKVNASAMPDLLAVADSNFIDVLVEQVGMLNAFRMHRQAQGIQTLARLQEQVNKIALAKNDDKERTYQELVNFHGEMLLLMHWSILAYTAIVKLLKKHHKRTGSLVQAPHLRALLSQPSWSTEVITGIISQTEMCIGRMQAHFQSIRSASDQESGQVQSNLIQLPAAQAQPQPLNPQDAGPSQQQGDASVPMEVASNPSSQRIYKHHSSGSLSVENEVVMKTIVSITSGEDSHDSGVEDHDEEMPQADEAVSGPPQNQNQGSGGNSVAANHAASPNPSPDQCVAAPAGAAAGAGGAGGSFNSAPDPSGAQRPHSVAPHSSSGIENLVNIPLLQQMHVALRTWDYLYDHASTPSTVLGAGPRNPTPPPGAPQPP